MLFLCLSFLFQFYPLPINLKQLGANLAIKAHNKKELRLKINKSGKIP
jgi:hypothetical protein